MLNNVNTVRPVLNDALAVVTYASNYGLIDLPSHNGSLVSLTKFYLCQRDGKQERHMRNILNSATSEPATLNAKVQHLNPR